MKNLVSSYVDQFRQDRQKQLKLVAVLAALAVVVAGIVFWQLHSTGVAMTNEVFCGMEEHTHGDDCYEDVLICDNDDEDHVHGEECYARMLVCDKVEHTHTIECMINENADLETAADWEATLPALTGNQAYDVVSVAQSQVGYSESEANFRLADDGVTRQGYTRYGEWYGNAYGDWDAMFASFCLNYADVSENEFPEGSGVYAWSVELDQMGLYEAGSDCTPAAGDLIFFDQDGDGTADHVGIVAEIDSNENTVQVIEGDSENAVRENEYEIGSGSIVGFGILPGQETVSSCDYEETDDDSAVDGLTYSFEDKSVAVTVILPEDTDVPEDAVLTVASVTDADSSYSDMVDQVEKIITAGEVEDILFYDIGFTTSGGEYLHVDDSAQVIIEFKDTAFPAEGGTHVLHFDEASDPTDLAGISKKLDENGGVAAVSFDTDGFSVFAVADIVPLDAGDADLYISYAGVELGYSGTGPFDEDNEDGNDKDEDNDIIRSFDRAGYNLSVDIDSKTENSDASAVRIHFQIRLQGSDIENEFYTQGFSWANHYEITEGDSERTILGYYDYSNSDGVVSGEKSGLSMVVQLLAMADGKILQPTGQVWLEELDDSGSGTGALSDKVDLDFPALEVSAKLQLNVALRKGNNDYTTMEGTYNFDTSDSGYINYGKGEVYGRLSNYGIDVEMNSQENAGKGMKGQALPDGDKINLTITLNSTYQVDDLEVGTNPDYRGWFLNLGDEDLFGGNYQLLFYALEGNTRLNETCADGRSLVSKEGYTLHEYYSRFVPYNQPYSGSSTGKAGMTAVENGGTWTATSQVLNEETVTNKNANGRGVEATALIPTVNIEVSSYEITQLLFPYSNPWRPTGSEYYEQGTAVEDIDRAIFSAGELWILQPYEYTDSSGVTHNIMDEDEIGRGTFDIQVEDGVVNDTEGQYVAASYDSYDQNVVRDDDGKIVVTRDADGNIVYGDAETKDVDTQVKSDDDSDHERVYIDPEGGFYNRIKYTKTDTYYNVQEINNKDDGTSWAVLGQDDFTITGGFDYTANTAHNTLAAANAVVKFDAGALAMNEGDDFLPELVHEYEGVDGDEVAYFFGYLPSGENWESDDQMQDADEDDLIWYSERQENETCVAVLFEYRQPATTTGVVWFFPSMGMHVLDDDSLAGNVYMTCEVTRVWTVDDVAEVYNENHGTSITYNDVLGDEDGSEYIKGSIPSAGDGYFSSHDTSDLPEQYRGYGSGGNYNTPDTGTRYEKKTYSNGSSSGHTGDHAFGDSLLILSYTSGVDIGIAQEAASQTTGDTEEKKIYSFDDVERVADLVVTGSFEIIDDIETAAMGDTTTTITVTLPAGATYQMNSAKYGIADSSGEFSIDYTQSDPLGQQGTVTNGESFEWTANEEEYQAWLADEAATGGMLYISVDANGNTTLTFSVKGVPIQGTDVVRIYFSVELGDESDPDKDLKSNDELVFDTTIRTTEDNDREFSGTNGNVDSTSIQITATGSNTFSKYALQSLVEVSDDLQWVITWDNTSNESSAMCEIMDDMPDNYDDGYMYASDYNGSYEISGFQIDLSRISAEDLSNLTVYYTTDPVYDGDELVLDDDGMPVDMESPITWEQITGNWETLTVNPDGTVDFSKLYKYEYDDNGNIIGVSNHVYAWAIGGFVPAGEGVHITLTVHQYGAQGADYMTNLAYDSTGNSVFHRSATIYRALRTISGTVWLDEDLDGGIDTGYYKNEQRIYGVRVYLQIWNEEDEQWEDAKDVYGGAYTVVTETGDGDNPAGYYEFTNLGAGTYRVLFADNTAGGADQNYLLSEHVLTAYEKEGIQDAVNSKAVAYDANARPLAESDSRGMISNLKMPELSTMTVYDYVYDKPYQNAGYTKNVPFTVNKLWLDVDGKDITDQKLTGSVTVKITASSGGTEEGLVKEATLDSSNNWKYEITDLPYYDGNGEALDYTAASFTVEEIAGNEGYNMSVGKIIKNDDTGDYSVTVTNQAGTELPVTGGIGTWIFTVAGVCLIGGAAAALVYRKRRAVKS